MIVSKNLGKSICIRTDIISSFMAFSDEVELEIICNRIKSSPTHLFLLEVILNSNIKIILLIFKDTYIIYHWMILTWSVLSDWWYLFISAWYNSKVNVVYENLKIIKVFVHVHFVHFFTTSSDDTMFTIIPKRIKYFHIKYVLFYKM